jgi:hypothetical protein
MARRGQHCGFLVVTVGRRKPRVRVACLVRIDLVACKRVDGKRPSLPCCSMGTMLALSTQIMPCPPGASREAWWPPWCHRQAAKASRGRAACLASYRPAPALQEGRCQEAQPSLWFCVSPAWTWPFLHPNARAPRAWLSCRHRRGAPAKRLAQPAFLLTGCCVCLAAARHQLASSRSIPCCSASSLHGRVNGVNVRRCLRSINEEELGANDGNRLALSMSIRLRSDLLHARMGNAWQRLVTLIRLLSTLAHQVCVWTLHDGAAADNTLLSAVSVTLTCGSVGLPRREESPFSAARASRGAPARSDVRVPQRPASGPGHSPRRLSARGEWHGRSESRPS